jgi:hypothetical protein
MKVEFAPLPLRAANGVNSTIKTKFDHVDLLLLLWVPYDLTLVMRSNIWVTFWQFLTAFWHVHTSFFFSSFILPRSNGVKNRGKMVASVSRSDGKIIKLKK